MPEVTCTSSGLIVAAVLAALLAATWGYGPFRVLLVGVLVSPKGQYWELL